MAKEHLEYCLFEQFGGLNSERIVNDLEGPLISPNEGYIEFVWYKKINETDTAKIFITVYKYPKTFSLRDDFFWNKATMNKNWNQIR